MEKHIAARAQQKRLLQGVDGLADGVAVGEGAVKFAAFGLVFFTQVAQRWESVVADIDVGVGFVIPQQHIVARAVLLDEGLLKQ